MFRQKLKALDYHSSDGVDVNQQENLKALVVWLEDQKIRHYKIEERQIMRTSTGDSWKSEFKKYLNDIECPYSVDSELHSVIDWLLTVAVRYEYGDASAENQSLTCNLGVTPEQVTATKSALDIDAADKTFISGVQALASILQVSNHPDISVLLEATRLVIEEKLSKAALLKAAEQKEAEKTGKVKQEKLYNVTAKDCGFDLNDPVLNEAAKVLRLLHIQELRYLQTNINELIVAVQAITANPKTDQSLGQVGK